MQMNALLLRNSLFFLNFDIEYSMKMRTVN